MEVSLKVLVLGLGNPILTDDGVGIYVMRQVAERSRSENVAFAEASVGGLRLLDVLAGYDRVIMVDAIQTPNGKPGDVLRLHPNDVMASKHSDSTHDLSFPAALALGRSLGMALPADEDITILAIEADDVLTFGEQCTPGVGAAIPRVVETVLAEINNAD
jgi:hydrogenase maturation protease